MIKIGLLSAFFLLAAGAAAYAQDGVHAFQARTIDGDEIQLNQYAGKVLLIVNVASKCGFTPQYESLQTLYEKYRDQGFEILAFPSNDFKQQEPGTNEEIKEFCKLNYGVTFPLFEKIVVKGRGQHPLYAYLTQESAYQGPITWNFNKFLVDPYGNVVGRFDSAIDPLSEKIQSQIQELLDSFPYVAS